MLAHELAERYPPDPDAPHGVPAVLRSGKTEWVPDIPDTLLVASTRDPEHLALVWDADRLAQVVGNLVRNAVSYGAPGAPITVRSVGDETTVTIHVHNHGKPTRAKYYRPCSSRSSANADTTRSAASASGSSSSASSSPPTAAVWRSAPTPTTAPPSRSASREANDGGPWTRGRSVTGAVVRMVGRGCGWFGQGISSVVMRRLGLVLPLLCGLLACKEDDTAEATASEGEDTVATSGSATDPEPTTGATTPVSGTSGDEGTATASATDPDTTTVSGGDTTTEDTTDGTTGGPPALEWVFDDVFGRANVDDDDDNGKTDWLDAPFDADNELAKVVLPGTILDALPAGSQVRLRLSGSGEDLRAWIGGEIVLGGTQGSPLLEHTLTPPGGDVTLAWEFLAHNASAELTITRLDAGVEIDSFVATLRASPLITNHHLQPAEQAWVVAVNGGQNYNNISMVQAMQSVLGDKLTQVPEENYDYDVWIQDEFEWATARSSDGGRMNVVIDSIRNRGLDDMPEDSLVGPDYVAQTWGEGPKNSYDSFGNLDASPPVTVDGVFYPFGRIYYGAANGEGINYKMAEFLVSQEIQRPFELDTTWLCVGHVDEFSTFVPDASAPKGFRLLFADVPSMYKILDALPKNTLLPRYNKDYGYGSIGEITGDGGMRAFNEDIQTDHLDGIRAVFKKELGLDDADIILIPTIFESLNCGGVALVPGTVNLAMFNFEGQPLHTFVPDPFLRADSGDQSSDPIIADFKARMPKDLVLHFVDNWNVYHTSLGEVHCGTNVQRAPLANWWEEN